MNPTQMLELVQKGIKTVINVFHMLEKLSTGREDIKNPTCSQLLNKLIPGLDRRNTPGWYLPRATRGRLCVAETRI